jgi:ABC-type phosphate/phosphonate transport system permease subunit
MTKDWEKLFSYYNAPKPPNDLLGKIMKRINQEKKILTLKRRLVLLAAGLIGAIILFIPALRAVISGFAESGFAQYFSLLFSDAEIVLAYWQNYALSLLETLPVMSVILLLATIFAILELLKLLAKDLKNIYLSKQLIHN